MSSDNPTAYEQYEGLAAELPEVQAASIALIPLTQDDTEHAPGQPGGPINRRLAFELAEMIGKDHARDLVRFAQLVEKFAS